MCTCEYLRGDVHIIIRTSIPQIVGGGAGVYAHAATSILLHAQTQQAISIHNKQLAYIWAYRNKVIVFVCIITVHNYLHYTAS